MKSFSLLSLMVSPLFIAVNARQNIRDAPSTTLDIQDGQTGVLMVFPPVQTFTGTKRVPDADHPFIAPGPNDMRGPCPGMNTLANHGYISRNGITTFEEIILGAGEAFNIDPKMASVVYPRKLTRGNPFVNKVSIGGVSPLVPPLPGQIDGPVTQGIAKHGRVEGDGSLTRSDVHIGDNRNFNQTLWDQDLEQLAALGDDGPDGPATVFNLQSLVAMARHNLETDQVLDLEFAIPFRRLNLVYGAPSLVLGQRVCKWYNFKAQALHDGASSPTTQELHSKSWHRAAAPVLGSPIPAEAMAALPEWVPGHNDENGVFVADPKPPAPFNISQGCGNYWDVLVNAVPASLANVTGIFKQNVDLLTGILFNASGVELYYSCLSLTPEGASALVQVLVDHLGEERRKAAHASPIHSMHLCAPPVNVPTPLRSNQVADAVRYNVRMHRGSIVSSLQVRALDPLKKYSSYLRAFEQPNSTLHDTHPAPMLSSSESVAWRALCMLKANEYGVAQLSPVPVGLSKI
ncbi:hypothetical protein DFH09DRAFT_1331107 [Mycena vulgaris]|nr:hypothetical protein DFH09DRAFT_1331107 [Mycena vulgaris]